MIILDQLQLAYPDKVLYEGISGVIRSRDRIALVGNNGTGKTTLLKVMLGRTELDGGSVQKEKGVTIGYLPQDGIEFTGRTLFEEVRSCFVEILALEGRLDAANGELLGIEDHESAEYRDCLEQIGEIEHALEDLEAHKLKSRIEKVLMGLGFRIEDMERSCGEFSGGWQMRIALAKLLLQEPKLLMLDEPTNHLDIESLRWLELFLRNYAHSILVISHDQAFLDNLCNRTFELTCGKLHIYEGNYSYYKREQAKRRELLASAHATQQKKIAETERFIERFRSKASKAKQVQSRIKALSKVERLELEQEDAQIHFRFPAVEDSGQVVATLRDAGKTFGEKRLFKGFDWKLEKQERVGIVGVNGIGKSTLAKIIAQEEALTEGSAELGYKVSAAYFAQHQTAALNSERSLLECVLDGTNVTEQAARNILGAFLFRGDAVFKKIRHLSGGEKCRIALARILLKKSNFIILDEPTNHLDIPSKNLLQEALMNYEGTLLIISHDRAFVDPIVNKVVELAHEGITTYPGNVSEYLKRKEEQAALGGGTSAKTVKVAEAKRDGGNSKQRRREAAEARAKKAPIRNKIAKLESEISELETQNQKIEAQMAAPGFYGDKEKSQEVLSEYRSVGHKLGRLYEQWSALSEELGEE